MNGVGLMDSSYELNKLSVSEITETLCTGETLTTTVPLVPLYSNN